MVNLTPIDNGEDLIDSRSVIKRISYLEDVVAEMDDEEKLDLQDPDVAELTALRALAEQAEDSPDWIYGETLIRDSYFETYARDLAEDIGAIDHQLSERWPYTHLDWRAAAEALKADYADLDFDGITYWIRA